MNKEKKIIQAIVVIIVVGVGWIHNIDKNSFLYEQFSPVAVYSIESDIKSDSLKVKVNSLYTYTKDLIGSSIQHLISKL